MDQSAESLIGKVVRDRFGDALIDPVDPVDVVDVVDVVEAEDHAGDPIYRMLVAYNNQGQHDKMLGLGGRLPAALDARLKERFPIVSYRSRGDAQGHGHHAA